MSSRRPSPCESRVSRRTATPDRGGQRVLRSSRRGCAGSRRTAAAALLAAASVPFGCASPPDPARPPEAARDAALRLRERVEAQLRAPAPGAGPDALRVVLAFEPGVDLDLYVTGPRRETVYYAHTPSAIGGFLLSDHRCDSDGDPLEEARFPAAPPGVYRIGVDYPEACPGVEPVVRAFAVGIGHGATRRVETGFLAPREFRVRVLDFEIPAPNGTGP